MYGFASEGAVDLRNLDSRSRGLVFKLSSITLPSKMQQEYDAVVVDWCRLTSIFCMTDRIIERSNDCA